MIIKDNLEHFLVISDEGNFDDFYENFRVKQTVLKEKHIIIKISDNFNVKEEKILLFLDYSKLYKNNNKSFVIVYKNVDADKFPDTFNVVPTLKEAEDLLEMEAIERDLGF